MIAYRGTEFELTFARDVETDFNIYMKKTDIQLNITQLRGGTYEKKNINDIYYDFFIFIFVCRGKTKQLLILLKSKIPPKITFYFIQGLDYKFDLSTNIRYRGILYSDRLEKLGYPFGLELALEGGSDGSSYLENYKALFWQLEIDKPIEEKMKEIFGELSVLNNNNSMTKAKYEHLKSIRGKNIPLKRKMELYIQQ